MKRPEKNGLLPMLGIAMSAFMLLAGFYQLEVIWFALSFGRESWELPFGIATLPLWFMRDLWYLVIFVAWWLLFVSLWFRKLATNSVFWGLRFLLGPFRT